MTTEQARRRGRYGFTLVELLVVIVIITALAAIIVPAVYVTVGRAKQARIGLEVANLARALERYKMEYGEYPPDFSSAAILTGAARRAEAERLINEHLSAIYRRRAVDSQLPYDEPNRDLPRQIQKVNGIYPVEPAILDVLDPSTALVFWLQGFSPNPQFPIAGSGDRSPLMDFDKGRLQNAVELVTVDGQPHVFVAQYAPNDGGQRKPYLYYRAASYTSSVAINDPNVLPAVAWANDINSTNPLGMVCPPYVSSTLRNNFVEPERFQIVSAGLDGEYGTVNVEEAGSVQSATQNIQFYASVPDGENCTEHHRDNLTSFSEGIIGDLIED